MENVDGEIRRAHLLNSMNVERARGWGRVGRSGEKKIAGDFTNIDFIHRMKRELYNLLKMKLSLWPGNYLWFEFNIFFIHIRIYI